MAHFISRVTSMIAIFRTLPRVLVALLIATHEPPGTP